MGRGSSGVSGFCPRWRRTPSEWPRMRLRVRVRLKPLSGAARARCAGPCGTIAALHTAPGHTLPPANPLLSLLVPVDNEGAALGPLVERVLRVMQGLPDCRFVIVFIDDGSADTTRGQLRELVRRDRRLRAVLLSRNFGKEAALSAGLDAARGDAVIPLDVDLRGRSRRVRTQCPRSGAAASCARRPHTPGRRAAARPGCASAGPGRSRPRGRAR